MRSASANSVSLARGRHAGAPFRRSLHRHRSRILSWPGAARPSLIAGVLYRDFSGAATTPPSWWQSRMKCAHPHRCDPLRARYRGGAAARPPNRPAAGLRSAGSDADLDRRLGNRAERLQLCRRRQGRVLDRRPHRPQLFIIQISGSRPGHPRSGTILEGRYQSSTGMGMGIMGARRLMDQFQIESAPGRDHDLAEEALPRRAPPFGTRGSARIGERRWRASARRMPFRNCSIKIRNCSTRSKRSAPARWS